MRTCSCLLWNVSYFAHFWHERSQTIAETRAYCIYPLVNCSRAQETISTHPCSAHSNQNLSDTATLLIYGLDTCYGSPQSWLTCCSMSDQKKLLWRRLDYLWLFLLHAGSGGQFTCHCTAIQKQLVIWSSFTRPSVSSETVLTEIRGYLFFKWHKNVQRKLSWRRSV